MKKTAKTLLGVLSVGALVGTGYAMWHVNGGFTSYTTDGVAPGIETIVDDKFGTLEVTAIDDKIRFDSNYNKETGEDLDVSYKVKAVANVIDGKPSDRDPYDLSFYETISSEYLPNLKVTTIAMKGEQELEGTDPFFKYVNLPVFDTVSYKEWLSAEAKANEGYVVNLNFTWGDATEGINPDEYWRTLDPVTQKSNFEDLTNALKDVTFKFVFEVGGDDSVVDNKTDEITITTVEGSTLSIEGMSNGTVTEGTHQVTLDVTEENKVLKDSKVYVTYTDQEGVPGNDEIFLEAQNGRAVYETYVGEYTFKANFKYELTYELVDDMPVTEMKTFYFKDVAAMNAWESVGYVYAWNSVNNEKNAEWPGVAVTQLSWNVFDDNANVYMGEIDVAKYDKFIFNTESSNGDPMGQTRDISISEVDDNNFVMLTTAPEGKYDVTFADYESTIETKKATINLDYNEEGGKVSYEEKQYYNNDLVTLNIEPNEGYTIDKVLLGDTTIEPEDGVYKATVKTGENNFKVTFVKEAVDYSIGQITAASEYTIRGVVAAKDNNSLLIHDGTDGVLAYDRNLEGEVGDYLIVTGGVEEYNGLYQFAYNNSPAVSIVEKLSDNVPTLPEATELTTETLDALTTSTLSTKDVKLYKWRATCGTVGSFKTLNIEGSDINIEPTTSSYTSNLVVGWQYDVEAYFIGYSKANEYISVMLVAEPKLIEVNAASVTIVSNDKEIKVGGSTNLTFKSEPENSTNTPKWTSMNEEVASVDENGLVTGVSAGQAEIVLEMIDAEGRAVATDSITINVVEKGEPEVFSFSSNFKVWDGSDISSNKLTKDNNANFVNKFKEHFIDYDKYIETISGDSAYINDSAIKLGAGSAQGILNITFKSGVKIDSLELKMQGYQNTAGKNDDVSAYIYLDSSYENNENLYSIESGIVKDYPVDLSEQVGNTLTIKALNKNSCRFYITSLTINGTF